MVMVTVMEEEEIQHVVSIDLARIVLQSVDCVHEELPQPKLVKAVVSDLFYFHAEIDGFPPARVLPPVVPVPIFSDTPTPVDNVLTVAAPIVSAAPTFVDDMLVVAAPVVSAALTLADIISIAAVPVISSPPKVFVDTTLADVVSAVVALTLAVSVSPIVFDDLFVDIASVIVIPTGSYAWMIFYFVDHDEWK